MENNKELMKRIKKLLALASSPNKHEAESAALKAQELMLKHNLNMQSIKADCEYINIEGGDHEARISTEASAVSNILIKHFFVRCYFDKQFQGYTNSGKRRYVTQLRIVGTESNIEVAKYVHDYLMHTFKALWNDYKKLNKADIKLRKGFIWGLFHGLNEKLSEQKKKVENEMGLVVVPDHGLTRFMNSTLNLKSGRRDTFSNNMGAFNAGKERGRNINIARGLDNDSSNSGRYIS